MCVICVSKKGVRQPNNSEIADMFKTNPHGAGYMYVRNGKVQISKGYMALTDYLNAIKSENFSVDDLVVYHMRISTQAGVNQEMTHPYPLTKKIENCKLLDLECSCGVAHNGIIQMTTDRTNTEYNDTTLFITKYLNKLIRCGDDLKDPNVKEMIYRLTNSKWAILDGNENLCLVGHWEESDGLLYSNLHHKPFDWENFWDSYGYKPRKNARVVTYKK